MVIVPRQVNTLRFGNVLHSGNQESDMDGRAVVLCEGCFEKDFGKTTHGLVRYTSRYDVVAVIDSDLAGRDAGEVLDKRPNDIPIIGSLDQLDGESLDYLVIGMAPAGGRLPDGCREIVKQALRRGLNVDSGLHDFLSEDPEISAVADEHGCVIRDIRRPKKNSEQSFFTGEISEVCAKRIAVLGTDCAIGKRTTAVRLVQKLNEREVTARLIGTGQTSWFQGARYGFMLDATVNDFVGGELERVIVDADRKESPDFIVIEGQACLTHPAGAGGFEILGSARPHGVILQHAPAREFHVGYDVRLKPPEVHIQTIESMFDVPVVGLGLNPEGLQRDEIPAVAAELEDRYGVPCCDPITQGVDRLVDAIRAL